MTSTQSQIRKEVLAQLKEFCSQSQNRVQLSRQICEKFQNHLEEKILKEIRKSSLCFGLYRALPSELEVSSLADFFRKKNFKICFPRVNPKQELEFVEEVPGWVLEKGKFGVEEPSLQYPAISKSDLDVLVIPGVVFGKEGQRVGRGKGFYDRFLSRNPKTLRVSLAFDFQIRSGFELQDWDEKIHWIVTEKNSYETPELESWLNKMRSP